MKNGVFIALTILLYIINGCRPIVFSPHCQNELMSPYAHEAETHELIGAVAYNHWVISRDEDTTYVQTYPRGSLSISHCAYVGVGMIDGFGGVETIHAPAEWWDEDASGIVGIIRPYLGIQYARPCITMRLNIAPFQFCYGFSDEGSEVAPIPSAFTEYQLTMLLHNPPDALHHIWCGVRGSPGGSGLTVGADLMLSTRISIRGEYSYVMEPVLPSFLFFEEMDEIDGSVHYLTIGTTIRIK